MPALRGAKLVADWHGALELQQALAELIRDGSFARHVRRIVRIYRERRDVLVVAAARHLAGVIDLVPAQPAFTSAGSSRAMSSSMPQPPPSRRPSALPFCARRPRAGVALGFA
jgi:GntR family transcriptional regulator/MocR family aminotransferase